MLFTCDWVSKVAFSATVWKIACLSPVCPVSCRPDDEVMTTSYHRSAALRPHKHLRDSPGETHTIIRPEVARWEDFFSFNGSSAAMIEIFPCAYFFIVVGWVVGLPGLEMFVSLLWLQLTHDWFCHLYVYPYHFQVNFRVARLQSPSSPLCDSPLSSSFCLVILSAPVLMLPVLIPLFVATYCTTSRLSPCSCWVSG